MIADLNYIRAGKAAWIDGRCGESRANPRSPTPIRARCSPASCCA